MSIGKNITILRERMGLTQKKIADLLDVTDNVVSSWEMEEYEPNMDNQIKLAKIFKVSISSINGTKTKTFETKKSIYDWEHMKRYVEEVAKKYNLKDTLNSVEFAVEAHYGQTRKNSEIPYIYHPLNMACHALAMGIRDDSLISAILLHDIIEDCGKLENELPVGDESKEIVSLMTRKKSKENSTEADVENYYEAIQNNPKASLVKCLDRCNNLTSMAWGLSKEKMCRMIDETERYYPKFLESIKNTTEYNNVAWLLKYQIESMLDIYKIFLQKEKL